MRLFAWELRKLFAEKTALAGLALVAVVMSVALLGFGVSSSGEPSGTIAEMRARGEIPLPSVYKKGIGFTVFSMPAVARTLMPFIVIAVLAGTLAGEKQSGELAETLARPVGRGRLLAAKLGVGVLYAVALATVAALVAPGLSSLALGPGKMAFLGAMGVPDPVTGAMSLRDASWGAALGRLALAYALLALSMTPIVAMAVLASAAAENARTAVLVAGGAYFGLLAASGVPGVGALRRYLLLNHLEVWTGVFSVDIKWTEILRSSAVITVALALLVSASYLVLKELALPPRQETQ